MSLSQRITSLILQICACQGPYDHYDRFPTDLIRGF